MLKRALIRPALILLASLSLAISVLATFPAYNAQAAGGFNAGNIIHDSNFYTSSPTMSVEEIQNFLNVHGQKCTDRPGAPCLKKYKETTKSRPADNLCPKPYQGAANESAATIIWKTANACNIAPQVILVTLQKEQSLVTSVANGARGYRSAMGYGCPDFAKCNSAYYGFSNQVYNGARQFQRYRLYPNKFNFAAGRTSFIQYHPVKKCGGTNVKVQNAATAALYNYTPYQPGGGGKCETFGNHNFFKFYSAWFGDPQVVKTAAPAPKAETPPANTQAPTGTEKETAKQEAEEKKPAEVESLSVTLADSSGNALKDDKGVEPGAEVKVKVSNLDAKAKPVVKLDGVEQKAEVKAAADPKDVIEVTITAPGKAENHTVSVSQVGEDSKPLETKKEAEATFWVFYAEPTVMSVTTEDNVAVANGGKVEQGKKLNVKVGGLKPDTTPAIAYANDKDKNDQKKIEAPKVNGLGIIEFSLIAPEKLGKYNIVIPGVGEGKGTSFAFEVIEKAKKTEEGDKVDPPAKETPKLLGAKRADGSELKPGDEVAPGEEIVLNLSGLTPNEKPRVEVHSDPIILTVGPADAKGNLGVSFKAPQDQGLHHVKAGQLDKNGKVVGELVDVFSFKVRALKEGKTEGQVQQVSATHSTSQTGNQLAQTGQATAPLLALMIMLVGTGLAVTSYARARQPISVN